YPPYMFQHFQSDFIVSGKRLLLSLCLGLFLQFDALGRALNVVLIIADDLRPGLGCYGDTEVKTPQIDSLAERGMVFERAYVQYPVCNASRTSFLTGWRPDRTGVFNNRTQFRKVHPDIVTLPQLFRQNGYYSAGIGKLFHAGSKADGSYTFYEDAKSFDYFSSFSRSTTALGNQGEGRNLTNGELGWARWLAAEGGDEDQPDGMNAADAVKILEKVKDKPFFLGVGFHKPHDPFHAPKNTSTCFLPNPSSFTDNQPIVPRIFPWQSHRKNPYLQNSQTGSAWNSKEPTSLVLHSWIPR
ncbi:MAG: sulfatase-like hydrolase/transferase, partial [Verrucomicrobia bacterium]|nr:sulfatase-like hydrolase/transferase [Verrucomicrobiota bacterium]